MCVWESAASACLQSSSPKGPSQPKVLLVIASRSALIFLSGKPFPDSLCNVHTSGTSQRAREGKGIKKLYEITQDEDYCCCCWCGKMTGSAALLVPARTEMFDYTESWVQRPAAVRTELCSSFKLFHLSPPRLSTASLFIVYPCLHSLSFSLWNPASTHLNLSSPPYFHPSIPALFPSFQVGNRHGSHWEL